MYCVVYKANTAANVHQVVEVSVRRVLASNLQPDLVCPSDPRSRSHGGGSVPVGPRALRGCHPLVLSSHSSSHGSQLVHRADIRHAGQSGNSATVTSLDTTQAPASRPIRLVPCERPTRRRCIAMRHLPALRQVCGTPAAFSRNAEVVLRAWCPI